MQQADIYEANQEWKTIKCPLCSAEPGEECVNFFTGSPIMSKGIKVSHL